MLFRDRQEAGKKLAQALSAFAGRDVLILAIPRGGVVVAGPVAAALKAELDVIIPRKVGAPGNKELAVAAVTPDGTVLYNEKALNLLGLNKEELTPEIDREIKEIERRLQVYRGTRKEPRVKGRTVIIIDDGLATGFTMEAALISLTKKEPRELILAVPVAPPDTLERLRPLVSEVVCLFTPEPFYAVGQFYHSFPQVEDEEVLAILRRSYWKP
ncbi:Predicted phosphoribosyltransferase [Thermanaeromonas toyohensis ToBE]|uniref:Predicted phosphoribosyltransferase n=1 Tax=Thermanaeromonas toyohensis ToBE TaxID=698762 RepID=A0A1W1W3G8_9FIRM|nr:phosphoribosyltransferase family protein [Thermanaeromonas toyohensis]SMC00175.1 Predicted phosphoribosyltransferase [Thermanaeromonas toyohensis ToBE]